MAKSSLILQENRITMKPQFETGNLVTPVQKRLFSLEGETIVLEKLINAANLAEYLFTVAHFKSAEFCLSADGIKAVNPPTIDRLSMVYPVSFEIEWDLWVSGYFKVQYAAIPNPLPHRVNPFKIRYNCIITPTERDAVVRNERVALL